MNKDKKIIYTCPMHPNVIKNERGDCPECHMALEKKTVDAKKIIYTCPMHPDVMQDSRGDCPHCHMALEKKTVDIDHTGHDKHEGHSSNIFRTKFWVSLAMTIPVLYFSETIRTLLGFEGINFTGSSYIPAFFGVIIFLYGGLVFLRSGRAELANRTPGMMTLISMAISVAFIYSSLITLNIVDGMSFWWELATLITIMLLGHWLEMASISNAQGALKELANFKDYSVSKFNEID